MQCTLCKTPLLHPVDAYYFRCSGCGAYVKNVAFYVNEEQEKLRYETHHNDVEDVRYQRFTSPITNAILAHHTTEQLGLDYGCGTGPVISKQLSDQGYQVVLYDPYFYPEESYLNFLYDYIFSCEVFEHFYQPRKELEKLLSLLKPSGMLYIMTHLYNPSISFENWYYRKDPTHVFIYTQETIKYIASAFQLQLIQQTERLIIFKKVPQ